MYRSQDVNLGLLTDLIACLIMFNNEAKLWISFKLISNQLWSSKKGKILYLVSDKVSSDSKKTVTIHSSDPVLPIVTVFLNQTLSFFVLYKSFTYKNL